MCCAPANIQLPPVAIWASYMRLEETLEMTHDAPNAIIAKTWGNMRDKVPMTLFAFPDLEKYDRSY
jgi:hypothetical protein